MSQESPESLGIVVSQPIKVKPRMTELKLVDAKALRAETELIKSKVNEILKESSERLDCQFLIAPKDSEILGDFKIAGILDRNKYRLTEIKK